MEESTLFKLVTFRERYRSVRVILRISQIWTWISHQSITKTFKILTKVKILRHSRLRGIRWRARRGRRLDLHPTSRNTGVLKTDRWNQGNRTSLCHTPGPLLPRSKTGTMGDGELTVIMTSLSRSTKRSLTRIPNNQLSSTLAITLSKAGMVLASLDTMTPLSSSSTILKRVEISNHGKKKIFCCRESLRIFRVKIECSYTCNLKNKLRWIVRRIRERLALMTFEAKTLAATIKT